MQEQIPNETHKPSPVYDCLPEVIEIFDNAASGEHQVSTALQPNPLDPPTDESHCPVHFCLTSPVQILSEQGCELNNVQNESECQNEWQSIYQNEREIRPINTDITVVNVARNPLFGIIAEVEWNSSQSVSPESVINSSISIPCQQEQSTICLSQQNNYLHLWNNLSINPNYFRVARRKISQVTNVLVRIIQLLIFSFITVITPNSGCTVFGLVSGLPSFLGTLNINSVNTRDLPDFHRSDPLVQYSSFSRRQQRNRFAGSLDAIHDSLADLTQSLCPE